MESEDIWSGIGSFIGGLFGGGKASKQATANAQAVAQLASELKVVKEENVKQQKWIYFLIFGLVALLAFIFIIVMKKRRK